MEGSGDYYFGQDSGEFYDTSEAVYHEGRYGFDDPKKTSRYGIRGSDAHKMGEIRWRHLFHNRDGTVNLRTFQTQQRLEEKGKKTDREMMGLDGIDEKNVPLSDFFHVDLDQKNAEWRRWRKTPEGVAYSEERGRKIRAKKQAEEDEYFRVFYENEKKYYEKKEQDKLDLERAKAGLEETLNRLHPGRKEMVEKRLKAEQEARDRDEEVKREWREKRERDTEVMRLLGEESSLRIADYEHEPNLQRPWKDDERTYSLEHQGVNYYVQQGMVYDDIGDDEVPEKGEHEMGIFAMNTVHWRHFPGEEDYEAKHRAHPDYDESAPTKMDGEDLGAKTVEGGGGGVVWKRHDNTYQPGKILRQPIHDKNFF